MVQNTETQRLISLDAFRGFTIAAMILVNNPGSLDHVYAPFQHAHWHGCTPTDLIFPFFLFIVGVSMRFSFCKYEHGPKKNWFVKVLQRTVIIFIIGIGLNAFPFMIDYSSLRVLGVLQRIALAYGMAGLLCAYLKPRNLAISAGFILFAYWGFLWVFGQGDPYSIEGNLVRRIDIAILGESHLWQELGVPFDPEGLLSTLPAVSTVLIGYLFARLIWRRSEGQMVVIPFIGFGAVAIVLGRIWGLVLPLNKSLWTGSYVIYTAGFALLLLGVFVWVIDKKSKKRWAMPFIVYGMNPLFVYVLSELWAKTLWMLQLQGGNGVVLEGHDWVYQMMFQPLAGPLNGSLLFAVTHVLVFWVIAYIMYQKKWFVKI